MNSTLFLPEQRRWRWWLGAIMGMGLLLRLMVWRWHQFYPLGGDEREYFNQALTWLQGKGYHELPLMRPPLYPVFLAAAFELFDAQIQRVRLVQALIGSGSIYLQWLLTRLALKRDGAAPLVSAALIGLSYTLAANATELLTETIFLAGMTLVICLLLLTILNRQGRLALMLAAIAGIGVGLLALFRSVALPLLPLGGLWLLSCGIALRNNLASRRQVWSVGRLALVFLLGGIVTLAPWTLRNGLRYGQMIIVDTTGAENLWLDNDPAGREAVKRQLYALGDDRGARQTLAMSRGLAAIRNDPARFISKAAGEALKLTALEYWDDLRDRPAIWVPPAEVWLRLLLGDGIWLVLMTAGTFGLWLLPDTRLRWFFGLWAMYIVATSLIFHVELRYRLPLYPVLAVGAVTGLSGTSPVVPARILLRKVAGLVSVVVLLLLLMFHRPYLQEGTMLVRKHWALWRGAPAIALQVDPESALARVALARHDFPACRTDLTHCADLEMLLRAAIAVKPAHPYAHLMLGALLREQGRMDLARSEFDYETASLEDLQHWSVVSIGPRGVSHLDIGDGLDLGDIEGFYPATAGWRWTKGQARVWLAGNLAPVTLRVRMSSGRPPASTQIPVRLFIAGKEITRLMVGPDWQTYTVPIPTEFVTSGAGATAIPFTIETATFRPRALDRTDDDNRLLGVKVDWIEVAR